MLYPLSYEGWGDHHSDGRGGEPHGIGPPGDP